MRVAAKIVLSTEQFQQLTAYANSRSAPLRLVERSKLILAASQGKENREIAQELGISADNRRCVAK